MCTTKSMLLRKDSVYCPDDTDSHSDMLTRLGIKDDNKNPDFVRIEIIPPNMDYFATINEWIYKVDQDFRPDWYVKEYDKQRAYKALSEWAENHIFIGREDFEINGGGVFWLKDCKNVICSDSATVKAYGSATVEAYGSATVKACDSATVVLPGWASSKLNQFIISDNSTLKDCRTKTIYQSGSWKFVEAEGQLK